MTSAKQSWIAAFPLALAAMLMVSSAHAQDGFTLEPRIEPDPQSTPAVATAPTTQSRSSGDRLAELQAMAGELERAMPDAALLYDPATRKELAPRIGPILHRLLELLDEIERDNLEGRQQTRSVRGQLELMLAAIDDPQTVAALAKDNSVSGQVKRMMAAWIRAGRDPQAQKLVIDVAAELAGKNQQDDDVAAALATMLRQATAPRLIERIKEIIDSLTGPAARRLQKNLSEAPKLRSLEPASEPSPHP